MVSATILPVTTREGTPLPRSCVAEDALWWYSAAQERIGWRHAQPDRQLEADRLDR